MNRPVPATSSPIIPDFEGRRLVLSACGLALSTYQVQLVAALTERAVTLISVSPQVPDESLSMQQKHDLTFLILSDPGNTWADYFGVLTKANRCRPDCSDCLSAAQIARRSSAARISVVGVDVDPADYVVAVDDDGSGHRRHDSAVRVDNREVEVELEQCGVGLSQRSTTPRRPVPSR